MVWYKFIGLVVVISTSHKKALARPSSTQKEAAVVEKFEEFVNLCGPFYLP